MIKNQTTKRASKGCRVLKLPLVEKFEQGNSSFQALSTFNSLEKTLNSYPNLNLKCTNFMNKYIALRTIQQLRLDKMKNFPIVSKIASNSMYLVSFFGSVTSIESAKSLIEDLIKLFNADGFKLLKWSSNEKNVTYLSR